MKVAHGINIVVHLASEAERLDQLKRSSYGMNSELGLDVFSDDARAYVNDPNPGIEALEEFLQLLDLDTLERLQALMYSGRPGDGPAREMKSEFHGDSKEEIVRAMAEKRMNLHVYFSAALDRAYAEGLDIERF